jgi:hypothetical protein
MFHLDQHELARLMLLDVANADPRASDTGRGLQAVRGRDHLDDRIGAQARVRSEAHVDDVNVVVAFLDAELHHQLVGVLVVLYALHASHFAHHADPADAGRLAEDDDDLGQDEQRCADGDHTHLVELRHVRFRLASR